jgi:hypothetical protein
LFGLNAWLRRGLALAFTAIAIMIFLFINLFFPSEQDSVDFLYSAFYSSAVKEARHLFSLNAPAPMGNDGY